MSLLADVGGRFRSEFVGRLVSLVATGTLTVVLARLLSPDGYGLLFLAISIFSTFQLFSNLGLSRSAGKHVAEYREKDPAQVAHVLKRSLGFVLGAIVVVGAVIVMAADPIVELVDEPALGPLLSYGPLFVLVATLLTFVRLALQGFERITHSAIVNAVSSTARVVFACGLVLVGFGVVGALLGYVLAYALTAALGLWFVYDGVRELPSGAEIEPGLTKRIVTYAVPLTATKAANVVDKRIDVFLIGFFLNAPAVGFYVVARQVVHFVAMPAAALGFTVAPALATRKARSQPDAARGLYEEAYMSVVLLYVPAAAGLFVVAEPFVELAFGADYGGAVPVVQVFAAYLVFAAVNSVTGGALDYVGRARHRAIAQTVAAVTNFGLNVVLIPEFGVLGAAWASLATFGAYTATNVYVVQSEFGIRVREVGAYTGKVLAVSAAMFASTYYVSSSVSGVQSIGAVVALGVVIWAGLSKLFGLFRPSQYDAVRSTLGRS